MTKSDIESAFRLLPVHPVCYHLLGCRVDVFFYYDTCCPMGCSISCHYFEVFSSFLERVVRCDSCAIIHYLDDFFLISLGDFDQCWFLLDTFSYLMSKFGVPLSSEKAGFDIIFFGDRN